MMSFILACIAIGIFIAYNIVTTSLLGKLPYSISGTYYLLNEKYKGSGIAFSIMIISVFLLLLYPWMYITVGISSWSQYLCILPFICSVGCIFVGCTPNIRTSKRIEKIHTISALVSAISALLWVCIVCWKIAYILPICILLFGSIAHLTKTAKSSRDWWLEMCVFVSTFTAIIIEGLLQL